MGLYPQLVKLAGPVGTVAVASFVLAVLVVLAGFVLALAVGRSRPNGRAMQGWTIAVFAVAALGWVVALGGSFIGVGTFLAGGRASPLARAALAAAGMAQICIAAPSGFVTAALALVGYGSVRLFLDKYK
ncbi:MAG: hypothetical protein PVH29_01915 [Candidatus Zixiibacteriota bacterium]|jgi:hypothetical protein